MASPSVSVVVPLHNASQYVKPAIQSILNQTLTDFELIVVDDASTDDSYEEANAFRDPRLTLLRHERNGGYPSAMQTALDKARGKYVARMDADDISTPQRLDRQVRCFEKHPDFAFIGTRRYWITPNGRTFYPEAIRDRAWVEESWNTVIGGSRLFTDPSVLAPRSDIEAVGGYRTYQRSGQDVDLWLRLLERKGKAATLVSPLYGRRLLPDAITFSPQTAARNKIPRILAEERRHRGTDLVMRGEPIPEVMITPEMKRHADVWRRKTLWLMAERCAKAGDVPGSLRFVATAAGATGWDLSGLRHAARYCLILMFRRNRIRSSEGAI